MFFRVDVFYFLNTVRVVNKNEIITVKLFDFIGHEKFNLTNENRNLTKIE